MKIKNGLKEYKPNIKAIKNIYEIYKNNIDNLPIDKVEFTTILLLIIEGLLPLDQAQNTFWDWCNGGKKWIK